MTKNVSIPIMGLHERVFLVEDDDAVTEQIEWYLKNSGHTMVSHQENLKAALGGIKEAKEQGATVAVVDGNLTTGKNDCGDGKMVAEAIRKQAPNLTIVAFSRSPQELANYGDIYVYKDTSEYGKLAEAITAIPRK